MLELILNFWNLDPIIFALELTLEPTIFFRSCSRVYLITYFFVPF